MKFMNTALGHNPNFLYKTDAQPLCQTVVLSPWIQVQELVAQELYTTLVEAFPRSMHEFLGANLLCTFRGDVV